MGTFNWESFLRQWSQDVLESMDDAEKSRLCPEIVESGWLGYPGATEAQLLRAEARLRVKLPPSYRAFLKVTNGWRTTPGKIDNFNHRFWSTEDIERFAVRHSRWIKAFATRTDTLDISLEEDFHEFDDHWQPMGTSDEDYFVYGDEQDPRSIRPRYLKTVIEISDVGFDSIYLLNPQVITPDGEWEAWFFAEYLPGADRYRSFQAMMAAEYRNFLELRESQDVSEFSMAGPKLAGAELQVTAGSGESLGDESNQHALAETQSASQPESPAEAAPITWQSLSRLTVEFQGRQLDNQAEYRTIVSSNEFAHPQTWPGLMEHQLQQWLWQQVSEMKNISLVESKLTAISTVAPQAVEIGASEQSSSAELVSESSVTAPEQPPPPGKIPALALDVDQLVIRQPVYPIVQVVVRPSMLGNSNQLRINSLVSQELFAIEVEFHLAGEQLDTLTEQAIFYKARFFAQNRITQQQIDLGETLPEPVGKGQFTYTATLFNQALEPGIYRVQVVTSLSGTVEALGAFELPLLNVA
ncbi:hypothetical protein Lepto7375DRAFT_6707 [Leptolyngbya sp. PCC 7375]|nr:hypothetical protein Lepto7375DRAFT_6707 [Leptolyngbya sp. PCC 7375]